MFKKKTLFFIVFVLLAVVVLMVLGIFRDFSSSPQRIIKTFENNLQPDSGHIFTLDPHSKSFGYAGDQGWTVSIVSSGRSVPFPDAVGWGGGTGLIGTHKPMISPTGAYVAYIDKNKEAIFISDTVGHRISVTSDLLLGTTTGAGFGIQSWNLSGDKMLFGIFQINTCAGEMPPSCVPGTLPSDAQEGYYIADLKNSDVLFLGIPKAMDFEGWLNDTTLLFEEDTRSPKIYEYDLQTSQLRLSWRFSIPGWPVHNFYFIGSGSDGSVVFMRTTVSNSGSPQHLIVRRGFLEKDIATFEWGSIQARDIVIAQGRYVRWGTEEYDLLAK